MDILKAKWLSYTVMIALFPICCRLLIWCLSRNDDLQPISAADLVTFGLVLNASNINELEHRKKLDSSVKTLLNGTSILFISVFGMLFSLSIIGEPTINSIALILCLFALAIVSLFISYSVYKTGPRVSQKC